MVKNLLLAYFGLLSLTFTITNMGCADPEGCTDRNALNYDPNAVVLDGSCIYESDKFIGEYIGSLLCGDIQPVFNQDSMSFQVTRGVVNPASDVLIIIRGYPIDKFVGTVSGNNINFNFDGFNNPFGSFPIFPPIDLDNDSIPDQFEFQITGSGILSDSNVIIVEFALRVSSSNLPGDINAQCTLTGTKV